MRLKMECTFQVGDLVTLKPGITVGYEPGWGWPDNAVPVPGMVYTVREVRGHETKVLGPYVWSASILLVEIVNPCHHFNEGFMESDHPWIAFVRVPRPDISVFTDMLVKKPTKELV
jgi:hypothetical protein